MTLYGYKDGVSIGFVPRYYQWQKAEDIYIYIKKNIMITRNFGVR